MIEKCMYMCVCDVCKMYQSRVKSAFSIICSTCARGCVSAVYLFTIVIIVIIIIIIITILLLLLYARYDRPPFESIIQMLFESRQINIHDPSTPLLLL